MKGDYSQPGLMPGRYLEQIDLPSAYLVYAVERRLRGTSTTYAGRRIVSHPSIPIGRSRGIFSKITITVEVARCQLLFDGQAQPAKPGIGLFPGSTPKYF
jgi:hypothetical protein